LRSSPPPKGNPWFSGDVTYWGLAVDTWSGGVVRPSQISNAERHFPSWRNRLRLQSLVFDSYVSTGNMGEALPVAGSIDRLRRMGGQEALPAESALALAGLGRTQEAATALSDCAARAPRLHPFDRPHYFVAMAFRKIGDYRLAGEHATEAYRQAWADGPPYCHAWNLDRSARLLNALGMRPPSLLLRAREEMLIPLEADLRALLRRGRI